jgi:hypothetical protein
MISTKPEFHLPWQGDERYEFKGFDVAHSPP